MYLVVTKYVYTLYTYILPFTNPAKEKTKVESFILS